MSSSIWFSMLIKGLNLAPKKRLDTALSLPSLVRIGKFVRLEVADALKVVSFLIAFDRNRPYTTAFSSVTTFG